ncbi:MAG TPA: alpha/beta fold hydrolase [Terriglobales bacterium]|nr:alpha/beta fold hydrolase [Terriglobales bacterium]
MVTSAPEPAAPPLPAGVREAWDESCGHRMRYLTAGEGRPLLLLHGLMGYSFSWRFNLAELARHATVYAVDLLGMGFSERCDVDYSLRAQAQRLEGFLNQLKIGEFDLLGTSHGGAVAMLLATLDPRRVRRMVLSAPANPWSPYGRWLAPFLSHFPGRLALPWIVRSRVLRWYGIRWRMYGDRRRISPGTFEGYSAAAEVPGTAAYVHRILEHWIDDLDEVQRELPRISKIPTLLVWGTRDRPVPFASAEVLRQRFENAGLVVFEGVGHLPYEEVPDAFNRAVIDFLTR